MVDGFRQQLLRKNGSGTGELGVLSKVASNFNFSLHADTAEKSLSC
jgi:hypothetical protein